MKNKLLILILAIGLAITTSCDYGDTNIDPANPQDVTVNLLLPSAQARMAYFFAGDASRYNGMLTHHFTGSGRQHLVLGRNQIQPADVNTAWNQQYSGTLQDLNIIIQKSEEATDVTTTQFSGAAKFLMANIIIVLSDLYGNVPFSDALKGTESQTPSYDDRDAIYTAAHDMLADARNELSVASTLQLGGEDLLYGGNTDRWIKATYALDARLFLHEGRYEDALNAAENGFSSNADDMEFVCGSAATENNPWYQFEQQRGDVVMGKYFIDLLQNLSDPRLPFYAIPSNYSDFIDEGEDPIFLGALAGNPQGGESAVADLNDEIITHYTAKESAVPFITYAEQKFIEAEAHLMKSSPDAAAAAEAYNEAVAASVLKVTKEANPEYIASTLANAGNISLQGIIEQKYIALFTQMETWNDWRRTGYPILDPIVDNNLIGEGNFRLRWPLPQGEIDFNRVNWELNAENATTAITTNGIAWDGTVK